MRLVFIADAVSAIHGLVLSKIPNNSSYRYAKRMLRWSFSRQPNSRSRPRRCPRTTWWATPGRSTDRPGSRPEQSGQPVGTDSSETADCDREHPITMGQ